MTAARRRLRPNDVATFRALRHRNARIFFAGLLVSNIGTWLQLTAMSLLVYDLTGKATDLGITVALQFLPMLVLGAWAGAVADRRDKRTLALFTQSLLAVQALVLGVVVLAGLASVARRLGADARARRAQRVREPGPAGLVTELVEPHDIANATSLNTAVMTGSRIFGPALGALLVETVGTAGASCSTPCRSSPCSSRCWLLRPRASCTRRRWRRAAAARSARRCRSSPGGSSCS